MPVTPDRSLAQRRAALAKANTIRAARKRLKAELKARGVDEVLRILQRPDAARSLVADAPAGFVDTMEVLAVLIAARGIGTVKASRMLRAARIAPSKTLGGMTHRQREELVALVRPMRRLHSARPTPTPRPEARTA